MALYLHERVPECDVVAFHYRGYRPSTGQPSAEALLSRLVLATPRMDCSQAGD